jgi:putative flippase GtrA
MLAASFGKADQLDTKKNSRIYFAGAIIFVALAWDQIVLKPFVFIFNFIFLAAFLYSWWSIAKKSKSRKEPKLVTLGLAAFMLISAGQHYVAPSTPLPDFKLPENVKDYSSTEYLADAADGRTIYINGWTTVENQNSLVNTPILVGNSWFLTDKKVVNGYNYAGYQNFTSFMTENYRGDFSEWGLWRILETQNLNGQPILADLMQLDTIIALKNGKISYYPEPPNNWVRDDSNSKYISYKRTNKYLRTPFNISSNATVSDVVMKNDSITFRYTTLDNEPAKFVFPRLAWPGYSASIGKIIPRSGFWSSSGEPNPPTDTFLLALEAPPGKNLEVKLEYSPPAWNVSTWLFYFICLLLISSEVVFQIRLRKKQLAASKKVQQLRKFLEKIWFIRYLNLRTRLIESLKLIYSNTKARYIIFGLLNTLFGYLSFVAAAHFLGLKSPPTVILLVGLVPSILFAYTTHRLFIWRSKGAVREELPKFMIVTFTQFALNLVLLELLVSLGTGLLFSQTLITITMPVASFFAHKYWTFNHTKTVGRKLKLAGRPRIGKRK